MPSVIQGKFNQESLKKNSAFILLGILLIANFLFTKNFMALNTFNLILTQICPVILTAMGMTIVISTGGIDISVGAIMALSAAVSAKLINFDAPASVGSVFFGIMGAIIITSFVGVISGFMVGTLGVQAMVVTLGLLIGVRGAAIVVSDSQTIYLSGAQGELYKFLGTYKLFGAVPIQIIPIVISIGLTYFLLNSTVFGRRLQSVGNNAKSSKLAGINTALVLLVVYWLSALFASTAGVFSAAKIGNVNPNDLGMLTELDAIAAVVIGGTKMSGGRGKVVGTVVGALIMIILSMSVNMNNIPHEFAQVLKAVIIVFAVYIQQEKA